MNALRNSSQEFSETTARAALVEAAAKMSLNVDDAHLLRFGSNAVFEIGDVVVRVMRAGASEDDIRRSVEVARWLGNEGIPAVEALDVEQPASVNGLFLTFWRSLGDGDRYGSAADLASILRRLHSLSPPPGLELPRLRPFDRAERRLREAACALHRAWVASV